MKIRSLWVALSLCCCASSYAQQSEHASYHIPCNGDAIKRQQVTYKDLERTGENVLWDMSDVETIDDSYNISYVSGDTLGHTITAIDHGTLYHYIPESDTIWYNGFENHTSRIRYDRSECYLSEPLSYGLFQEGFTHGYSIDSEKIFMRCYGMWTLEADATGMLILPTGDTLRHVTRVHSEKVLSKLQYPFIHSEEHLKQYIGSIVPYTQDSILFHLQNDSILIGVINNRWYADGYRYPVFETIATGVIGSQMQNVVAYYYPPSSQEELFDPDNEEIRNRINREDHASYNDSSDLHPNDERDNQPTNNEIQFDYNVQYQNGRVTVDYYNSGTADITCGIYTYMGMTISEMHRPALESGTHEAMFDISGQHPGIYMLVIKVNDNTYTEKINKK